MDRKSRNKPLQTIVWEGRPGSVTKVHGSESGTRTLCGISLRGKFGVTEVEMSVQCGRCRRRLGNLVKP